jgi:hypothetical protein
MATPIPFVVWIAERLLEGWWIALVGVGVILWAAWDDLTHPHDWWAD